MNILRHADTGAASIFPEGGKTCAGAPVEEEDVVVALPVHEIRDANRRERNRHVQHLLEHLHLLRPRGTIVYTSVCAL